MAPNTEATTDYYALLGIAPTASESEIRRAYRKTSLLYHPDKVKPTPETLDKFQLLQTAVDTLTDHEEKRKYDQTREAKLRRQAEVAALDSRRRQMVDDLERRERDGGLQGTNGLKRKWTDRELEIKRIQEENRKMMAEATAKKRAEAALARSQAPIVPAITTPPAPNGKVPGDWTPNVVGAESIQKAKEDADDSVNKTVKVRWIKNGDDNAIDEKTLEDSFAPRDIDAVVLLKDKKQKLDGKKVVFGRAFIVFTTTAAAKEAVKRGPWDSIESVEWFGSKTGDGPGDIA